MDNGFVPGQVKTLLSSQWASLARPIAMLMVLASVYYLWRSLFAGGSTDISISGQSANFYMFIAIAACVYGLSLTFLAIAWVSFLPATDRRGYEVNLLKIYGVTSIAKYLPSGVLHFGGRQLAGARVGLSHLALAKASTLEAAFSAMAAAMLGVFMLMLGFGVTIVVLSAFAILSAFALRSNPAMQNATIFGVASIVLFMMSMASIAAMCVWLLGSQGALSTAAGAYLMAWVAGFVIPGLVAGIGVREAVFAFLVNDEILPAEIALIVVFMRVLTTVGDGLFFLAFSAWPKTENTPVKEL
ncbi:MAG: hypothetical protein AAF936_18325 [Pseudomonadota bacterium]